MVGEGNWLVKVLIKKHIHHKRDFANRKNKKCLENKSDDEKENETDGIKL